MGSSREGEDPTLLCPSIPAGWLSSAFDGNQEGAVNHLHLTDDRTGVLTASRDGSLNDAGAAF